MMREGLKALLDRAEDITVIDEASDGREAVRKATETSPDVIVMDLTMPLMSGVEATRCIVEADPDVRILALSMLHDRDCVLEALRAGARGYLIKNCAVEELVVAIRVLAAGESYLCAKITDIVIQNCIQLPSNDSEKPAAHTLLSPRELEVLKLIAEGMSTKEIAYTSNVSIKTIDVRKFTIMKKLNIHNIAALIKYAIREGLTSIE